MVLNWHLKTWWVPSINIKLSSDDTSGSLPLPLFVQTMWNINLMWCMNTCALFFGVWNLGTWQAEDAYTTRPQQWPQMSSLSWASLTAIHTHCHNLFLKELSVLYVTLLGEDIWEPGFLWTLTHVPFPFTDFVLYPFAKINVGCEHHCMLSPKSFQ